jgi:hypothetical protein
MARGHHAIGGRHFDILRRLSGGWRRQGRAGRRQKRRSDRNNQQSPHESFRYGFFHLKFYDTESAGLSMNENPDRIPKFADRKQDGIPGSDVVPRIAIQDNYEKNFFFTA